MTRAEVIIIIFFMIPIFLASFLATSFLLENLSRIILFLKNKFNPRLNTKNSKLLTAKEAKAVAKTIIEQKEKQKEEEIRNSKTNQELLEEILKLIKEESKKGSCHLFFSFLTSNQNSSYRSVLSDKYSVQNYADVSKLLTELGYTVDLYDYSINIRW